MSLVTKQTRRERRHLIVLLSRCGSRIGNHRASRVRTRSIGEMESRTRDQDVLLSRRTRFANKSPAGDASSVVGFPSLASSYCISGEPMKWRNLISSPGTIASKANIDVSGMELWDDVSISALRGVITKRENWKLPEDWTLDRLEIGENLCQFGIYCDHLLLASCF